MTDKNNTSPDLAKNEDGAPGKKKTPPRAEPKKDWLGSQLRELYQSYAEEPLPEDLQGLLAQLGESEKADNSGGNR